jgi:hypothetical protein
MKAARSAADLQNDFIRRCHGFTIIALGFVLGNCFL